MHNDQQGTRGNDGGALVIHAVWMGVGFIGLSLFGGVATGYFEGGTPALQTALSTAVGAAIALASWRQAGRTLDHLAAREDRARSTLAKAVRCAQA